MWFQGAKLPWPPAHPIAAQGRFTTGLGERHGAGRRAVIVMNQHTSLAPSIKKAPCRNTGLVLDRWIAADWSFYSGTQRRIHWLFQKSNHQRNKFSRQTGSWRAPSWRCSRRPMVLRTEHALKNLTMKWWVGRKSQQLIIIIYLW